MIVLVALFFFNVTATTEIYTLSLHDALPIFVEGLLREDLFLVSAEHFISDTAAYADIVLPAAIDRKSTRLNSSHDQISYAVFCLKKKTTRARTNT